MARVLVTGAAGFTGRYVVELLAQNDHEVHGVVHGHGAEQIRDFARIHEADICDSIAIQRVIMDVRPHHVIHLAAVPFVAHADVEHMYRVNILGSRQLLDALSRLKEPPASVLLASSANVYGNACQGVLTEATPPAPANDYGVTKLAMEYVASIYRPILPLIVARPFNYTGRRQESHFIIPKIVEHVRSRASNIELGNIDVARDFSDVRVVAKIYAELLFSPDAIGETFNICSGRAVSLRELVELAGEITGHHLNIQINPEYVRSNEVRILQGSPAKLEGVIGPLHVITIEETLRWMIDE